MPAGEPNATPSAAATRRRQTIVMAGLFATFLGLLLASAAVPIGSSALDRTLPVIAAGLGLTWVGGILLGLGSPRRLRR